MQGIVLFVLLSLMMTATTASDSGVLVIIIFI